MMNGPRTARAGFTLVELVVASTLMALVLSSVYLTFSTAVRAWRSGESNYAPYQDARRALGMLQRELAGIPRDAMHLTVGRPDEIEFVTLAPSLDVSHTPGLHLLHVRYRIAEVDDADALVREEAPVSLPLPAAPGPTDRGLPARLDVGRRSQFVVARDVVSFQLQYRWPAPGERRGREVPPRPVAILSDSRVEYRLPQEVVIRLVLLDSGNVSGGGRTEFQFAHTFPVTTSRPPDNLLQRRRL